MGQSSSFVSARSGASGGLQLPTYGLRLGNQQGFANEQSNLDSRGISQGAVASYGVGVPAQSFLYGIRQPQKSTTGKEILGDHKIDINVSMAFLSALYLQTREATMRLEEVVAFSDANENAIAKMGH
ncbi:uncharacterized protein PHALS_13333 [Plasmopara halstedii]|uniref:Uncharacterized protein n=1 Tax=Plasmopara halstedii TaxID=4781 RepID=A0A0P1APZ3_PLAHL|nr:uncharacterized protein PHALS_13333 [Plasmopara halstedii]CEG43116.1 hypothetical protein PHALS_13333 [Plasmopara halstedii]|eukprot:XP_024579485.1 hypothetical protein PHALS_13333 [Plasmopara halstedii]